MSDLVKILLNIDKSKSLEINTKSINRGLSKICIFCQLSMRYISSKFRLHCLFYENASEPLFCSVLSGMILSFVNRGCWRHLEEEFPFLVLVLLCWIHRLLQYTGLLQCPAFTIHTGQLHTASTTFPSKP